MRRSTLTLVLAAWSLGGSGCATKPQPPTAPMADDAPSPPQEPSLSQVLDEPITIVNTLTVAVEVSVISNLASGESTTVRFGPIEPEGKATQVVKVQSGGSFVVQAHWNFDNVDRNSNAFTANLEPGLTITPVTLTLGATFPKPTFAQWKMVEWEEADGASAP